MKTKAGFSLLTDTDWPFSSSNTQVNVVYTAGNPYTVQVGPFQYQNIQASSLMGSVYQNIQVAAASLMGSAYQIQYQYQGLNPMSTIYCQSPETPQEQAEREKRQAARKAAEMRAERLLFTILKPAQVKQYTDDGYFDTDINGRIYRLHKRSRSMNVELIEAGKARIKFCAHPHNAYEVPIPDVLLSQMLMLRANEAEFLRIANRQVIQ